jgi:hypothetical protein
MAYRGFTPKKETPYPLHRRLGKPQSQPGHFGEDYLAPTRIQTPNYPAHSLVALTKVTKKHNRAKYGVTQNLMKTLLQIILQVINTVKMSGQPTPLEL